MKEMKDEEGRKEGERKEEGREGKERTKEQKEGRKEGQKKKKVNSLVLSININSQSHGNKVPAC